MVTVLYCMYISHLKYGEISTPFNSVKTSVNASR